MPVADDIVSDRRAGIKRRRQWGVGDVDRFERILGPVAGDDDYDRLALIAHALDRTILHCADPAW
jgi:hypothetical protein